jgi:hypothetical protein
MTKQNVTNNKKQQGKYSTNSGSKYHKEHASHVPDYDDNTLGTK